MEYRQEITGNLALDANGLHQLKQAAKANSPESLSQVAKQFEAIFTNMMLKSMRDATPQDSEFDNEQSRMFTSMLDQQLSSQLSQKGLGLADILVKQLSKSAQKITIDGNSSTGQAADKTTSHQNYTEKTLSSILETTQKNDVRKTQTGVNTKESLISKTEHIADNVSSFVHRLSNHAKVASMQTGIPAKLMLGQAALESGWGKREIKANNGETSHNLFGIKANSSWKGKVVETMTTEYINGVKQHRIEKFRAYDSYADSFKDFANLIKSNPRYQQVISNIDNVAQYTNAMQNAGYATDPQYAKKLFKVIQKITDI